MATRHNDGIKCPHCQTLEIVKFGIRRNIQWYRCKACTKTFSGLSSTFLSWTKKDISVWKKYVKCMMEGRSVRKAAQICGIHRNTAFAWRHKLLDALTQYVSSQRRMRGIVEMDDTFFRLSFKGSKPKGRRPHKRGTAASKRGISKEQVCVSCIISRDKKRPYSKVTALGMATVKDLRRVYEGKISKTAILCTDKATAFSSYAKRRDIKHIPLNGTANKLDFYHIQHINAYHSRLKNFIRGFKGVSTKYLNNYLVWQNAINEVSRTIIGILKLCVKATMFTRWHDLNRRPAIPV